MAERRTILARLAAFVLLVALACAPPVSALTHGFAPLAVEAGQTVSEAEDAGHRHGTAHGPHGFADQDLANHDLADHDHSPTVILSGSAELPAPAPVAMRAAQADPRSSTIREGPRRPPRLI